MKACYLAQKYIKGERNESNEKEMSHSLRCHTIPALLSNEAVNHFGRWGDMIWVFCKGMRSGGFLAHLKLLHNDLKVDPSEIVR